MDAHAVHAALTANGHALAAMLESMNIDADAMVFLILPTSANLAAAVDDGTGTGALVFAISPALVTPDIGTPSDGTLTNCDGLPAAGVVGTALVLAAIGTTVQAFSANLSEYAAVNPTAAGLALLDDADATAQRVTLGLVIGTDVQAQDPDIPTVSASQAEMEAGTEATLRSMSPLRVAQAIAALAAAGGPKFRAGQITTATSVTAAVVKIALNSEQYDTANCFDSTTNYRFTPNKAGYYLFIGNIRFATGNYLVRANLYKNGAVYSIGDGAVSYAAQVSDIIYMNGTTDYVELFGYSQTTQNTVVGITETFLSGAYLP